MKPLKCYAKAAWCLWNGHLPIEGSVYLSLYGKRVPCSMCKHCYKVLGPV